VLEDKIPKKENEHRRWKRKKNEKLLESNVGGGG
jgi:hypothetical protein